MSVAGYSNRYGVPGRSIWERGAISRYYACAYNALILRLDCVRQYRTSSIRTVVPGGQAYKDNRGFDMQPVQVLA
jgi:hypothetical protein